MADGEEEGDEGGDADDKGGADEEQEPDPNAQDEEQAKRFIRCGAPRCAAGGSWQRS